MVGVHTFDELNKFSLFDPESPRLERKLETHQEVMFQFSMVREFSPNGVDCLGLMALALLSYVGTAEAHPRVPFSFWQVGQNDDKLS